MDALNRLLKLASGCIEVRTLLYLLLMYRVKQTMRLWNIRTGPKPCPDRCGMLNA